MHSLQKVWGHTPADKSELLAWFQELLDAGRLDELHEGLSALDARHGNTIALAFVQAESRSICDHKRMSSQGVEDRISKLIGLLAQRYTPQLVDILDSVGICLREYGYFERAMEMYERLGESYQRNGDLFALARTWMWRGRSYTDRRIQGKDLPCYWTALGIFQTAYAMAGASDADRRKAASGVSSIQHQLAVKCDKNEDDALLYNYRALVLRDTLKDDHLRSGSYHNIAQRYQQRGDYGKALLNYLQAVRLDITSSFEHDRRITCENMGLLCWTLGEYETALLFYRKAGTFGLKTYVSSSNIAQLLLVLARQQEAVAELSTALQNQSLTVQQRLETLSLMVRAYGELGDTAHADECLDQLIAGLVANNCLMEFKGEIVRKQLLDRLAVRTDLSHQQKALMLFAGGESRKARQEVEEALQKGGVSRDESGLLLEMRKQLLGQGEAESGSQDALAVAPKKMCVCRACQSEFAVEESVAAAPANMPTGTLCSVCAGALQMEDLILIPAGKVVVRDYLTAQLPAFYIDRYLVTNRLFKLYHKACRLDWSPDCWNKTLWQSPEQPMTCVTLVDAEAFCAWRSRLTGRTCRVPTQEEWFRAALGDDARMYPWGNEPPDYTRAAYSLIEDRDAVPPPVGLYPAGASPFGVLDMVGTVWEYTSSKDKNGEIVYLGGSCDCTVECLTPDQELYRSMITQSPTDRTDFQMGFRCVVEVHQ